MQKLFFKTEVWNNKGKDNYFSESKTGQEIKCPCHFQDLCPWGWPTAYVTSTRPAHTYVSLSAAFLKMWFCSDKENGYSVHQGVKHLKARTKWPKDSKVQGDCSLMSPINNTHRCRLLIPHSAHLLHYIFTWSSKSPSLLFFSKMHSISYHP